MAPPPHAFTCSEDALAFAAFSREDGGLVLREYRRTPLEPGSFQQGLLGGPPRDPRLFGERVAELVSSLETPVKESSLVVPDGWLRTAFAGVADLPANGAAREEVLRWKLKRLVPFRVDELRVRAVEVAPLAGQEEPRRLLLGFGVESLLGALERSFESAGVHLGRIANQGLSALGGLAHPAVAEGGLIGLVLVAERGYSAVFARVAGGQTEPVLHRFKSFSDALPLEARAGAVRRDMRLTRRYLEDHIPEAPLGGVTLAAPEGESALWAEWLERGLDLPVALADDGPVVAVRGAGGAARGAALQGGLERPPWPELLSLAGTVCQEVPG
jgi:hypothetical protein